VPDKQPGPEKDLLHLLVVDVLITEDLTADCAKVRICTLSLILSSVLPFVARAFRVRSGVLESVGTLFAYRRANPVGNRHFVEDVDIMQPDFAGDVSLHAGRSYWRGAGLNRQLAAGCLWVLTIVVGCQRVEEIRWQPSSAAEKLSPELKQQVEDQLARHSGTPAQPRLLSNPEMSVEHLRRGQQIYQVRCAGCHGATGDGQGPAAAGLNPSPRDYRAGVFKFTSTPYGSKPTRDDLLRTLRNGAKGTSMPSFKLLPEEDLQAVIDYVLVLTHRGELERQLVAYAESENTIDADSVPALAADIRQDWADAPQKVVLPMSRMIPYSDESVAIGKKAFLTEAAGWYKCHGEDGRGRVIENAPVEPGRPPVRAADLTAGMFHGGNRPIDIYRRIYSGINGTPMPAFEQFLASEPDNFWHLVHYVQYVAGIRRREVQEQQAAWRKLPLAGAAASGAPAESTPSASPSSSTP
jgi:mono/diheme cytochrome c family protein